MPAKPRQRLEVLFQQALELEGSDRVAFLEQQCTDDPRLGRELKELLAADANIEATWSGLTLGEGEFVSVPELIPEGLSIPNYKIVRMLGQGGMGTVYLALRYDELFSGKPFAIKVVQLGKRHPRGTQQFAAERRILSRLDHPYIARLYDGGELPDGSPYLVMDYVDGRSLDRYCCDLRLTLVERLGLFRKICSAVHYAHQNLIVHRDIKPGNILVTADGTPRLVDFGIAKLLDPDGFDNKPEGVPDAPMALHYPLTPDYASPEQIRGDVVTTASDVYSLGVVLYQLLTDRIPRESPRPSRGIPEADAVLIAHDRRLKPTQLRRRLVGDLDDIVMKALQPEPERRYPSAQQLAEDLKRHLEILPVSASRRSGRYRVGKFVRRHRLRLAIAGSLIIAMAFTLAALVQSQRLGRTTAVLRQLAGPRSDPLMDEDFLDHIVEEVVALEVSSRSKALLMEVVRRLYVPDEALFEEVLEILGGAKSSSSQAGEMADLSLSLGRLLANKGLLQQAEPILRVGLEGAVQAHGGEAPKLARHLDELALAIAELGRFDEAEMLMRRGLDLRQRDLGEQHPDIATSLHRLAEVLSLKGAYPEAEVFHRQALEILRAVEETDSMMLATHLNSLALVLMEQGQLQEAESLIREVLDLRRRRLGDHHHDVLQGMNNLFMILANKGDFEAAIPVGLQTVELAGAALGPDHMRLSHPLLGLGAVYSKQGQPELCERYAGRALALREAHLPESHWLIALAQSTLGNCLTDLGRLDEAETLLLASVGVLEKERDPEDHWLQLTRRRLERLRQSQDGDGADQN